MNIIEFLKIPKRKILLSNKVSVGNTVLRNLNLNQNTDMFDVKVLKISDIAKDLVTAYDAYLGKGARTVIDAEFSRQYLENVMRKENVKSFPKEILSDGILAEVYKIANEIRLHRTTPEWNTATETKITDFKKILDAYEKALQNDNLLDSAMLILEAKKIAEENESLLSILLPWKGLKVIGNLETNIWSEAELEFIRKITTEDTYINIEYLNATPDNGGKIKYSFYKAYGIVNEIAHVVNGIKADGNPGKTALYYSDSIYVNFVKAAMENAGISYKLLSGNPATETDFVQFMLGLLNTAANNFLYKNLGPVVDNRLITFANVVGDKVYLSPISGYNDALGRKIGWGYERYIQYIALTRQECDAQEKNPAISDYAKNLLRQEFATFLEKFIDIFLEKNKRSKSAYKERSLSDMFERLVDFTKLYTFKKNTDWIKLKNPIYKINKKIKIVDDKDFSLLEKTNYIVRMLESISFDDEEEGNAVYVAPINGFFAIDRPEVYLIGLSALSFSINTKQSPILLDQEKEKYIECVKNNRKILSVDLSFNRNEKRRLEMKNAFHTMDHGNITFLYSYYDTIDLRDSSPSVFFLEMLGDSELIEAKGYVPTNYLHESMEKKDGNIYIDPSEMRKALDEMKEKREKAKKEEEEAKAKKTQTEVSPESEEDESMTEAEVAAKELEQEEKENEESQNKSEEKEYTMSATGFQTLLGCPFAYYYRYVNHLRVNDELENQGYEWIKYTDKGNLCHRTLEKYMAEAFPPKADLSPVPNMDLLNSIYEKEIKTLEIELPAPSEAIKKREAKYYKELITKYVKKVHKDWVSDSHAQKEYQVIGCEYFFDKLKYEDKQVDGFEYRIFLKGYVDRIDGYVDEDGILQLRIIDYKTGKKESTKKKTELGTQIQHYIYGIAALDYIKKYLENNDYTYGGKKVSDIHFEQIAYIFPYEEDNGNQDDDAYVYDVTEEVMACFSTDGRTVDGAIKLPDTISNILSRTIGALQNEKPVEFDNNCEAIFRENIAKNIRYLQKKKETVEKEKAQENFDKNQVLHPDPTAVFEFNIEDVEVDFSLDTYCKNNFCTNKNFCRKWVGGDE